MKKRDRLNCSAYCLTHILFRINEYRPTILDLFTYIGLLNCFLRVILSFLKEKEKKGKMVVVEMIYKFIYVTWLRL